MFWRFSAICTTSEVNYENFDLVTITSQAHSCTLKIFKSFINSLPGKHVGSTIFLGNCG